MPTNDAEVFDHLTADQETPAEIDYLCYAIFAFKKDQWIEHFKANHNGTAPTQEQIHQWISEITDYDFGQIRSEAVDFFDFAAKDHLKDYIEAQKREAVEHSILGEVRSTMTQVKSFTSPWKHLGMALLMAILAPVILGGIIFFLTIFDRNFSERLGMPSAVSQPAK